MALAGVVLMLACLTIGILVRSAWRLRGTTLMAPLLWGVVATVVVSGVELAALASVNDGVPAWLEPARFIAAVCALCPAIALLGAKRPQSRAWQFIVLTLLGILAQPAIVGLALHYGEPVTLHAARRWFLAALLLIGVVNYLPTRNAIAGVAICCAQIMLLWGWLPGTTEHALSGDGRVCTALLLATLSCMVALASLIRRRAGLSPWDRLWIDFRNAYGIVWSLRVEERLNASLEAAGETMRLGWNGFENAAQPAEAGVKTSGAPLAPAPSSVVTTEADRANLAAQSALIALMRRFVSKEWIAQRLEVH